MISAIIVFGTLAGSLIYSMLYFLHPEWRNSVEQPKHVFQQRLQAYDEQQGNGRRVNDGF
ncbi:MAG: hypothetical protein CMP84_04725 [Gammaproteobacteria bacterium]|jgi:hypothetical protein|nr:hypothetical protein [Gammaproteobacteria bacterium]MBU16066.1 hypothetical protein [Gammaproteobacteria bacterium]|tara:strand:+ start:1345 stop:1524 length:180 start_codon:yes stop_codon:yes gene_type:complete